MNVHLGNTFFFTFQSLTLRFVDKTLTLKINHKKKKNGLYLQGDRFF